MEFRKIKRLGMEASIIGLGAEHLDFKPYADVEETVHAALDYGINIMDAFMPGEAIRKNIGKALKGRRDKMLIQGHIGSTDINQQYDTSRDLAVSKKYFEELLRHLGTDYIDFGMLFFIDTQEAFDAVFTGEIIDYAKQLKQEGKIRGLGASSHSPVIAKKMVETGELDLLMFSINPAFDMDPTGDRILEHLVESFAEKNVVPMVPERMKLYRYCEENDVAITVMKTLGSGRLLEKERSPFGSALTVGQCIHYALTRPAVISTLVGCTSRKEVEAAVKYLSLTEAEKDYTHVLSQMDMDFKGQCVYCNHCLPCPVSIDIAAVNKYLDLAEGEGVPPSIANHYGALESHGGDCIACGSCEKKCPFGVPVISRMAAAAEKFGL